MKAPSTDFQDIMFIVDHANGLVHLGKSSLIFVFKTVHFQ